MHNELSRPGPLLDSQGRLAQVGWSRQPVLECNLENARFCALRPLQRFRVKRWDYYAIFTPRRFFSAAIADLGYAGNVFVYTLDYARNELHEEGLVIPLGRGIQLPRNSVSGETRCANRQASLCFQAKARERRVSVDWPGYHEGRGIKAEIILTCPPEHESMTITIPIGGNLTFTPFHERLARTALVVIDSEVHQVFGRYSGTVRLDDGQEMKVRDLVGFAEEHRARW